MKPFEFFDHTADIGVHAYGRTLEELFANAARALYEAQGRFATKERAVFKVELEAADTAELLVHWLAELLFLFNARQLYFDHFRLQITDGRKLVAQMDGGPVDFSQSEASEEIKAVTYHQLEVKQVPDGWMATVIFDV
ncbi:MAG: archease [Verrucomicrobia bacterium]|nr:archease [Verrucomicrobiota bacterium]